MTKIQFDTVSNIRRKHNGHFFCEQNMRFFKSKVYEVAVLHDGLWLFGTSEKGPDYVRKYTLRGMTETGDIKTIGEFQAYTTKAALDRAVSRMIGQKVNL